MLQHPPILEPVVEESSMDIYTPYTYFIKWSQLGWKYYGVRHAQKCNPNDLWITYFTSSKEVAIVRDIYGEPDIIQIRKTFQTSDEARLWETKVLQRMKVVKNLEWLNKTDHKSFDNLGKPKTIQHRHNMSLAQYRRDYSKEPPRKPRKKVSLETRKLLSSLNKGNKNWVGKHHTIQSKLKMKKPKSDIAKNHMKIASKIREMKKFMVKFSSDVEILPFL